MTKQEIEEIVNAKVQAEMAKIRKRRILILALVTVLVPLTIWAATITKPHTFTAGTPAVASQVNDNFDALFSKVNELDAKIEQRIGTYCGSTAATFTGNIGGYAVAKAACVTACGNNSNAHMCTSNELSLSLQAGIALPAARLWYSAYVYGVDNSEFITDCHGWTTNSSSVFGAVKYDVSDNRGSTDRCNASRQLACCL